MLLHVDCMQIPVPEEMLRKKASVTVPVLKGVQGSGTLSNVAETHDRVERGVTRPPAVLCWVTHFTRGKSSFAWYSVPLEDEYGAKKRAAAPPNHHRKQ